MPAEPYTGDSWRRAFPRLAELRELAPPIQPGKFFCAIPQAVATNPLAREVYRELEADLGALDDSAWQAFKLKLLRCDLKTHGHRGYAGIHSVLYEAKGYRHLQRDLAEGGVDFDRIDLIAESRTLTPEWAAMRKALPVGLIEVKTVYESDVYSRYVYENTRSIVERGEATVRRGDPIITDAFWGKLQSTVERARDQLYSFPAEGDALRIALLIVQFDHEQTIVPKNYATVASYLDSLSEGTFKVAHHFRGLNAPG